jgi:hypothetical protein
MIGGDYEHGLSRLKSLAEATPTGQDAPESPSP